MTDTDANIAIAEWIGWKPYILDYMVHCGKSLVFAGTQSECLKWRDELPEDSLYRHWQVVPRYSNPPDYCHDLNAIHLAELHFRKLHPEKIEAWCEVLMDLTPNEPDYVRILGYLSAEAPQRTRALMVMLGLWKE